MAEDDPGRESPGLNPEGGQRFFGFDEDISGVAVPAELPILPLRGVVIFPSAIVPLLISRGASLKLVEECLAGDRMLGLAAQKNPEEEAPAPEGLYSRGTAGRILKMLKYPDQSVRILVQGLRRIEIAGFTQREPYFRARIRHLQDTFAPSKDLDAIQAQVQSELNKNQKEFYLRQQLKAIQKELGEGDGKTAEVEELRRRIEEAKMPPEALKAAEHELERLGMIPPESAEHTVVRTYLEWLVSLPWSVSTDDNLDLRHARQVLDEDHFDLEKIKDRILEYLAVRQLRKDPKSPILCFVGPPGVGKTSLGKSIARAMGRKFVRLSLGGIRDEAEIRGHRRTYIGALPGRIIQNIKNAGSNNPLFMLDEIDKLGMDFRGDPAAALLEVLDPEQNNSFQDHYLDVPFDLQRVMFVTTANVLDPIPPALRDRMEVIELAGYTEEEKLEIARRHLIPKQLAENGLKPENLSFEDDALVHIIRAHTREAGLRNLEREIGRVCRKVARGITEGHTEPVVCTVERVREYLGPDKFFSEVAERTEEPGVAVGLAWTPNGGDILFIESTRMTGKKNLTLTGHLGEVMKESAQAALSYVRSRATRLGIAPDFFENMDIHIHVPHGAIPKDGPSAGVTIVTSLASLLTGRHVRANVAMTGEITLRGKVEPVGGVKEKVLAAKRAGIEMVILPRRNEKDLEDVPESVRRALRFVFVDTVDEVLEHALEPAQPERGQRAATA